MLQASPSSNIFTIDALYYQPELASIHLVRSDDRIAIIDTGTQHSTPQIKTALDELKLDFSHVDFVILTHIHLDHAGGAGSLMSLCNNAKLVVHPKGSRHMIDPNKLIAGTTAVYGEENFHKLYGAVLPVNADRIIQPTDGDTINFTNRPLKFIDTPGHASHHHCIIDAQTDSIFTGDTLGVSYRALRNQQHSFVMPTTTPVQFDPDMLHASIDKVMAYNPKTLYLTHYGAIKPNTSIIAGLHEQIDDYVMLTEKAANANGNFEKTLSHALHEYLVHRCLNELEDHDEALVRHWIQLDAGLNAQGLAFWWQHRKQHR